MCNILLVKWYNSLNSNCVDEAITELNKFNNIKTTSFPFLQRKNEKEDYMSMLSNQITDDNVTHILFWHWSQITEDEMTQLKKNFPNLVFVLYNWDDPYCWHVNNTKIFKYFDIVFCSCSEYIEKYKKEGVKKVIYLPPAFSPNIHYPEIKEEYRCDVSFVCTNFYSEKVTDNLVDRLELVKRLDSDPEIDFHLYGNEAIRRAGIKSYKKFINYGDNRYVFSSSKININIHGAYGEEYLNERTVTILGSGGVMLIDNMPGIEKHLKDGENCILLKSTNVDDVMKQIKDILSNYDKYLPIMNNAYKLGNEKYTYAHWAKKIIDNL